MVNALLREHLHFILRQQKQLDRAESPDRMVYLSLSLRTSLLQPWAVPSYDVINWTRLRSRASSCASYMCSKACLKVTSRSISLLFFLYEYLYVLSTVLIKTNYLSNVNLCLLQMLCSPTGTRLRLLS